MKKLSLFIIILTFASLILCLTSCGDCQHEFGEWNYTKAADCNEIGSKTRTCAKCGLTQVAEVAKLTSHDFGEWITGTPATCKASGEDYRECSVCSYTEYRTTDILTEHAFGNWRETSRPTCKDDGMEMRVCSVCFKTETHTLAKLPDHSFGEWDTVSEATCKEAGSQKRICAICQAEETQTLAKTAHQFGEAVVKAPTFFEDGSSTRTCSACGETVTETIAKTGTGVILYEDYSKNTVDVAGETKNVGGISYGLNGKTGVSAQTVTEDDNTYLKWSYENGSSDSNFNLSMSGLNLPGKLNSVLIDGKFTFVVKLKKEEGKNAASINFRLRGKDGTSDTKGVFTINSSSVSCLGNKIGDLSTEWQTFAITVDFTASTVTSYLDGTQIGSYELTVPSASSFDNWTEWTANAGYILNGNGSKNSSGATTVTCFDDILIIGGGIEVLG